MSIVALWLLFSLIVALIASRKGRNGFVWFLVSAVLSPLLALILVLIAGSSPSAASSVVNAGSDSTHEQCSDCHEFVLSQSNVCKHWGAKRTPGERPLAIVRAEHA